MIKEIDIFKQDNREEPKITQIILKTSIVEDYRRSGGGKVREMTEDP